MINNDTIRGQWNEIKGSFKQKWGKLTDNDLTTFEGNFDGLKGKLQKLYGYSKERASTEIDSALERFKHSDTAEATRAKAQGAMDDAKDGVDEMNDRVRNGR